MFIILSNQKIFVKHIITQYYYWKNFQNSYGKTKKYDINNKLYIGADTKNQANNSLKIYQVPFQDKAKIVLEYYQFGIPKSLADAKFAIIDKFANNIVSMCDKEHNRNQDFFFNLHLEPETVDDLRNFLSKHKKFVFKYTTSKPYFMNSHIYQLYLQYILYELTDVEKSIFLDAYINMITDLRGSIISNEKREKLEKNLHINRF